MNVKRIALISATAALVAGGAGAAIAATADKGKEAETRVLSDAAKRLNVSPDQLRDALKAAEDAELDRAVKAGELTQEQADAIKQRRDAEGRVLGGPGPGPDFGRGIFRGGPDFMGKGVMIGDVAKALGISERQLFEQLRDGKSLSDIAKSKGKSLDDVKTAVRGAVKQRLDKAVKDGDITQKQADAMLDRVDDMVDHLGDLHGPGFRGPGFMGPGFMGKGVIGDLMDDVAKALGISEQQLFDQLRDGKSLSDIAKSKGKSLDDVKKAVRASVKTRLDKAVKDGDLTQKQADAMLERFDTMLDHLGDAPFKLRFHGPRMLRPGAPPPPPMAVPGGDEIPPPPSTEAVPG